jgi:hypothetical protein
VSDILSPADWRLMLEAVADECVWDRRETDSDVGALEDHDAALRAENERLRGWIRDAAKNGCDSYITINCAGAGHNECDWCLPCRAVAFLAPKEDKG